jgi:hypothetical protein
MLVEKVAVAYWRLRRAYRYEVGLVRQELDTTTDDFYGSTNLHGSKMNKTDEEIDQEIEQQQKEAAESWKKDKKDFTKMHKNGKPLEEIYDWEENWDWLHDKYSYLLPPVDAFPEGIGPKELREFLNENACFSDDQIWEALIEICDDKIDAFVKSLFKP